MTVPIQDPIVSYTGNGVATQFAIPFRILVADDLKVLLGGVLSSAYSIDGLGDDEATITFTTAPASGLSILGYRQVALERTADYQFNGDLRAVTVNADFDRIWMALQDIDDTADRALHYPITEYGSDATLPAAAARATRALIFDAQGIATVSVEPFEEASDIVDQARAVAEEVTSSIVIPTFQSFDPTLLIDGVDYVSGTDNHVTLSATSWPKAIAGVFFDGVFQSISQWTLAEDDRTLTFSSVIPQGIAEINVMYFTPSLLGVFQQFVTGAVTRTFQSKMRDEINARDFGARGDTVMSSSYAYISGTDDTLALQAACFALKLRGGGRLVLSNGTYSVSGALQLYDNVEIEGRSARILYKKPQFSYEHCIILAGKNNSVRDLHIVCDAALNRDDTGFGISVNGASNALVENCTLENIASAAIWVTNAANTRVIGNRISNTKADGIHFSDGAIGFVASDNILSGTQDDAIAVVLDTVGAVQPQYGVVASNTVNGTARGHGVVFIGCVGLTIDSNTLTNIGASSGIGNYQWNADTRKAQNVSITDNLISQVGLTVGGFSPLNPLSVHGILLGFCEDTTVTGNTISDIADNAGFTSAGIFLYAYNKVVIKANTIKNCVSHGVWVYDATPSSSADLTDLFIDGNTFINVVKFPIKANPTSATLSGLFVSNNTFKDCAYGAGMTNMVSLGRTGLSPLRYYGNINLNREDVLPLLDSSTASDIKKANNVPAI